MNDLAAFRSNERPGPDATERALALIAQQHPEHREVLDHAGTMILRMAATIALIMAAVNKGRVG